MCSYYKTCNNSFEFSDTITYDEFETNLRQATIEKSVNSHILEDDTYLLSIVWLSAMSLSL